MVLPLLKWLLRIVVGNLRTKEDSFRAGVGVGSGIGGLASIEKTALLT